MNDRTKETTIGCCEVCDDKRPRVPATTTITMGRASGNLVIPVCADCAAAYEPDEPETMGGG